MKDPMTPEQMAKVILEELIELKKVNSALDLRDALIRACERMVARGVRIVAGEPAKELNVTGSLGFLGALRVVANNYAANKVTLCSCWNNDIAENEAALRVSSSSIVPLSTLGNCSIVKTQVKKELDDMGYALKDYDGETLLRMYIRQMNPEIVEKNALKLF